MQRARQSHIVYIVLFILESGAAESWEMITSSVCRRGSPAIQMSQLEARGRAGCVYLPDPDEVVRVPGEQSLTVSGPGQAGHLGRLGPGGPGDLRPQVLHQVLALQVPDLDAGAAGRTQPVPVGGEGEAVDGLAAVQGVQVLPVIEVPQHGLGVLPTAGTQGAVRRESHRVDVASVTDVVGLQLAVGQVPHLDVLVPASADYN